MLAEAWPQSSFREHVAKYDCFKQSIFRDADICVARGGLGPHFSYCNVPRIRVTRNCGAIPRTRPLLRQMRLSDWKVRSVLGISASAFQRPGFGKSPLK